MGKNIEDHKMDYSLLMDLRVDFAFKTFVEGNPEALISLLNAIFANAKINRIVKSVRLTNPNMDKKSILDKLSILDVRAKLNDGTDILIEMHLHEINQIKAKIIRSWARAYSEDIYCLRRVKTTAYKSCKKLAIAGFFLLMALLKLGILHEPSVAISFAP